MFSFLILPWCTAAFIVSTWVYSCREKNKTKQNNNKKNPDFSVKNQTQTTWTENYNILFGKAAMMPYRNYGYAGVHTSSLDASQSFVFVFVFFSLEKA